MLVLLMGVCRWDAFMWYDTYTKFHEDWYKPSSNIKIMPQEFEGCNVGIIEARDFSSQPWKCVQVT
jgi:hypothetical protein